MASIQTRKLQNGTTSYRVQVRLKGHPIQRATFSRLTDAKRWAQATEAAIREGRYFKTSEAKKHTVSDLIERYIAKLQHDNPKRISDIKPMLKWWNDEIGYLSLADLNRATISSAIDKLASKTIKVKDGADIKISPSRINRHISALSHACTVACNEWEWLQENPFSKIKKLREPRGRVRFLSDDERTRLLAACKNLQSSPLYIIVVLALSTGARKSEIMNLRWPDIDFQRRQIVLHETKNGERRVLPLTGHAYDEIKRHEKIRRIDTDLLFPSKKVDKPLEIKKQWIAVLKEAEIEDFRFHDLRHSAASYLAMNGATLAEIAEVLGHKTLQMVKRYAHLSEAHTSTVIASMNERIFGDGGI